MNSPRYVMQEQVRDKVREIMSDARARPSLVAHPSWLALVLLVASFNLIAMTSP